MRRKSGAGRKYRSTRGRRASAAGGASSEWEVLLILYAREGKCGFIQRAVFREVAILSTCSGKCTRLLRGELAGHKRDETAISLTAEFSASSAAESALRTHFWCYDLTSTAMTSPFFKGDCPRVRTINLSGSVMVTSTISSTLGAWK